MRKLLCILCVMLLLLPAPVKADGGGGGGASFDTTEEGNTPGGNPDIGGDVDTDKLLPPDYSNYANITSAKKDDLGRYVSGGYMRIYNDRSTSDRTYIEDGVYKNITAREGLFLYVEKIKVSDVEYDYYVSTYSTALRHIANIDSQFGNYCPPDVTYVYGSPNTYLHFARDLSAKSSYFVSNLPIFDADDQDSIAAYVQSGDVSGAENKDALDYIEAVSDDDISVPKVNVINKGDYLLTSDNKLTLGNVKVGWRAEQEGDFYDLAIRGYFYLYKDKLSIDWASLIAGAGTTIGGIAAKDIKGTAGGIAAAIKAFGSSSSLLGSGLGEWSPAVAVKAGSSGSSTYNFSAAAITKYVNDYLATKSNCSDYFISQLEVRVRHRVGNKYSKWRVVTIDYTAGTDGEVKDGEIRDDKDVVYPDNTEDSTTDTDVDVSGGNGGGGITINIDNSNENANTNTNTNNISNSNNDVLDQVINAGGGSSGDGNNGIDWSFSDLLGFIKAGFGLLGNSGFIALMSAVFPFLPPEIFTILTIGIAAAVTIMLINMIKRLFS